MWRPGAWLCVCVCMCVFLFLAFPPDWIMFVWPAAGDWRWQRRGGKLSSLKPHPLTPHPPTSTWNKGDLQSRRWWPLVNNGEIFLVECGGPRGAHARTHSQKQEAVLRLHRKHSTETPSLLSISLFVLFLFYFFFYFCCFKKKIMRKNLF